MVSDADLARYDAMAEALLAPDLAYHLLLAGLCRRTESQELWDSGAAERHKVKVSDRHAELSGVSRYELIA